MISSNSIKHGEVLGCFGIVFGRYWHFSFAFEGLLHFSSQFKIPGTEYLLYKCGKRKVLLLTVFEGFSFKCFN